LGQLLVILGATEFAHGRLIHARVGVHVILVVGREADGVIGGGGRVGREVRAIEVDAVFVQEVGIFACVYAAGGKPDLAALFIHLLHGAHHPIALGDLIFQLAGQAVI